MDKTLVDTEMDLKITTLWLSIQVLTGFYAIDAKMYRQVL